MPTAPLRQFVTKQHKQLTTRQLNRQNDTSKLPERQNPMTERRRFLTNVLSLQSERSFRLVNPVIFGQMNYQFYHPQWENAVHVATVGSIIRSIPLSKQTRLAPRPAQPTKIGQPTATFPSRKSNSTTSHAITTICFALTACKALRQRSIRYRFVSCPTFCSTSHAR